MDGKVTKTQFKQMLDEHDWYYKYADDHRDWLRGFMSHKRIKEAIEDSKELKRFYKAYKKQFVKDEK